MGNLIGLSHVIVFWFLCLVVFVAGVFVVNAYSEVAQFLKERKRKAKLAAIFAELMEYEPVRLPTNGELKSDFTSYHARQRTVSHPSVNLRYQGGWVSGELVLWLWGLGAVLFLVAWLREMRYPGPPLMQTLCTVAAAVIFFATAAVGSILWGVVQLVRALA
jgi:hypothetical protein